MQAPSDQSLIPVPFTPEGFLIDYQDYSTNNTDSQPPSKYTIPKESVFTSYFDNCVTQNGVFAFSVLSRLFFIQLSESTAHQSRGEGASQNITQKQFFQQRKSTKTTTQSSHFIVRISTYKLSS